MATTEDRIILPIDLFICVLFISSPTIEILIPDSVEENTTKEKTGMGK
jgi:hypothetical protein